MAASTPDVQTGWRAEPFNLPGIDGQWHSLTSLAGEKGTVVAFVCNHCPYVKAILPRLIHDTQALASHGVNVVAINSNDAQSYPDDSFENMVRLGANYPFAYLHDESQQVARAYDAICTPDFFGFDSVFKLQYRGRIEARGKYLTDEKMPRDLFDAMVQVANTGIGPAEQFASIGCSIKWRSDN